MDYVVCPFEDLPDDADPAVTGSRYSYASDVFDGTDHWIIADNKSKPTKIYRVPMPLTRMLKDVFDQRYKQGQIDAKYEIQQALGL